MVKSSVPSSKPLVKCNKLGISNMQQRSIILFHSAIKSENTKKGYDNQLKKYLEHFIIKDYDSLLQIDEKKTQRMIEDYVLHLRSIGSSRSKVKISIYALELFYSMNDIMVNWKKIKRMLPEETLSENRPYTTEELQKLVKLLSRTPNWLAFIHVMSASGTRAGFVEYLKMKDILDMPNTNCKALRIYSGQKEEYYTFIHEEAVNALNDHLDERRRKGEKLEDNDYVFTKLKGTKPLSQKEISSSMTWYLRKIPEIRGSKKETDRFEVSMTHGIRKRWNTIMKNNSDINPLFIEKMFGHSTKLIPLDSVYHKPTLDRLFEEYRKAIPELILNDNERLKQTIENQKSRLDSLENKDHQIAILQEQLHEVQKHLKELAKR